MLLAATAVALPLIEGRPLAESVGWMLLAGGAAEFALGWGAHRTLLGKLVLGSGSSPCSPDFLFLLSGWKGLFPLTTITMIWLVLRGHDLAGRGNAGPGDLRPELVLAPAAQKFTDLGLGLILLIGLPMASFAMLLFNETREMVSTFGVLLAISLESRVPASSPWHSPSVVGRRHRPTAHSGETLIRELTVATFMLLLTVLIHAVCPLRSRPVPQEE